MTIGTSTCTNIGYKNISVFFLLASLLFPVVLVAVSIGDSLFFLFFFFFLNSVSSPLCDYQTKQKYVRWKENIFISVSSQAERGLCLCQYCWNYVSTSGILMYLCRHNIGINWQQKWYLWAMRWYRPTLEPCSKPLLLINRAFSYNYKVNTEIFMLVFVEFSSYLSYQCILFYGNVSLPCNSLL